MIDKKKKIALAGFAVVLVTMVMLPVTQYMEKNQDHAQLTAQMLIEPIMNIREQMALEAQTEGVVVEGILDIESVWAIEDARQESETPLISRMVNGSTPLGYDRDQNTFYCTLGMNTGENWPEIRLEAKGGPEGLRIACVDDYTYDWCSDAIREGWRYELIAYNDTHYSYFGLVFTGLPIVSVHSHGQISGEESAARVSISSYEYETTDGPALIHLRGGTTENRNRNPKAKESYRLEFQTIDNRGRNDQLVVDALDMPADSDWILQGNDLDVTGVRNHLCWQLWNKWNADGDAHALLESRLVEVFVDDQYQGLYQLMQRIDFEEEMARMDANPQTDYVFRTIRWYNTEESRPYRDYRDRADFLVEIRHKPDHVSAERAFEMIEAYVETNRLVDPLSDEEFEKMIREYFDLKSLISYYLFLQAADLADDNVKNNMYIWAARQEDGSYKYHFSPWDMDMGLSSSFSGGGGPNDKIEHTPISARRTLTMDILGSREMIWEMWNEKKPTILTEDEVYAWIVGLEEMVNRSGAYLRESEKWQEGAQTLNMAHFSANEIAHIGAVEYYLTELWPVAD